MEEYLKDVSPPQREEKTYVAYKYCLEQFLATSKKRYVSEIEREDLLEFIRHQYQTGRGPRTAFNQANILVTFLKLNGLSGLLKKSDWPSFVDPLRPIYEPEVLNPAFCRMQLTGTSTLQCILIVRFPREGNALSHLAGRRFSQKCAARNI